MENTGEAQRMERPARAWLPAVDILETADELTLLADMPGVEPKSVEVTIEGARLTVNGKAEAWQPEAGYRLVHAEYEPGEYHRSFAVSNQVDRERIEATVRNGVLRLRLPKAGPAKTRRIEVKAH